MSIVIDIIPSKSYAHRMLICAALSETPSHVECDFPSADIEATKRCIEAMKNGEARMDCGESGSTLRFMIPVLAAKGQRGEFHTEGRLAERPLSPLSKELSSHGCQVIRTGTNTITSEGQLEPGTFILPGNVTSQFVSGILMALPILRKECRVIVTGRLQSAPYIDMTLDVMEQFGIRVQLEQRDTGRTYILPSKQAYHGPEVCRPEGDWSAASNWLVAGVIGTEPVSVRGLNPQSRQGDREIITALRLFGADIRIEGDLVTAYPSKLHGAKIDVAQTPDLAPAIALAAARAQGVTKIDNTLRLHMKESDRVKAICSVMEYLGVKAEEQPNQIWITGNGGKPFRGGTMDNFGDHRVVMMEAIASLAADSPVVIRDADAVSKSYPGFFQVLEKAGLAGNVKAEWR